MKPPVNRTPLPCCQKGFTMIEMLVVMAIFSVFIMMAANSFTTIMKYSTRYMKAEESNIEGVVGLEMLRHDVGATGYGLATSFSNGVIPTYSEATVAPSNLLNDAGNLQSGSLPRAIVGLDGLNSNSMQNPQPTTASDGSTYTPMAGSDYLTIKSVSLGGQDPTQAAQKWTYVTYSSSPRPPKSWASNNLNFGDGVIVLSRSTLPSGLADYQLVFNYTTPGNYWTTYNSAGLSPVYSPGMPSVVNYIYGIAPKPSSGNISLGMPFNRADYFVATPANGANLPAYCEQKHTGILYKAVVNNGNGALPNGTLLYQPLLDCVAKMQVVLGWNMLDGGGNVITSSSMLGTGQVDTWTNIDGTRISGTPSQTQMKAALADPGQIRTKLKVVKIYVLAQNGKLDPDYTSPLTFKLYNPSVEGATPGSTYTLQNGMQNYRWKVYELIVSPKNLQSNE